MPHFHTANGKSSPSGIVGGLFRGSYPYFFTICDVQMVGNLENTSESENSPSNDPADGDIELVREAKRNVPEPQDYSYSERDVILYNLSVGATEQELHWAFENHEDFAALPTFGVIPQFLASSGVSLDFLPNFNPVRNSLGLSLQTRHPVVPALPYTFWLTCFLPLNCKAKLLHGEQFLSIEAPIPTNGDLVNEARYVRPPPHNSLRAASHQSTGLSKSSTRARLRL